MPSRILKESICSSDTIDKLSPDEECFFYRLLVQCDDYGRLDARPSMIRAKLYPLRIEKMTNLEVCQLLAKLVEVKLVIVYIVENRPYIQVLTWDKHQQIRAKKSRYPAHEINNNHLLSPDFICNHMLSDDCEIIYNQMKSNVTVIQSNPIQSNPIRNPIPENNDNPEILNITTSDSTLPIDDKFGSICKVYEENIGQISPMMADRLKIISTEFTLEIFKQACEKAVTANARNMNYIQKVLNDWKTRGFQQDGITPKKIDKPWRVR